MASKKKAKREKIRRKLYAFLNGGKYAVFTISISNVSSNVIKKFRADMEEQGIHYMFCKNAVMRKLLSNRAEELPEESENLRKLIDIVKDNVTFLFIPRGTDLFDLKKQIERYGEYQDASVGKISPNDVILPKGHIIDHDGILGSLDFKLPVVPTDNIAIRLTRSVLLCKKGEAFTQNQSALLNSLRIKPCFYQLTVVHFYLDGQIHPSSELSIDLNLIRKSVEASVREVASLSMKTHQWLHDDMYSKKTNRAPIRYRLEPKYNKR